jgi:hypothetical protein
MRKLLFSPILLLAFNAMAQVTPPPPPPGQPPGGMQMPEFIVPVQIGTDTLKNGKATVTITQQTQDEMKQGMASPDYVVMLTPVGECGSLTLAEKNDKTFVVKEQKGSGSSNGIFQYEMIAKQKRPARPGRPMPPMQPGQGGLQAPAPPVPQVQH